jgi:hypothetical protein
MIRCSCGKENSMSMKYCSECNASLEGCEENSATSEEADQGFSCPDSLYEGPQLKSELSRYLQIAKEMPRGENEKVSRKEPGSFSSKTSETGIRSRRAPSRLEIKQSRMNQLRLELELKEKLQQEQYQRLSQYMYQGLNQDYSSIDQKENKEKKKISIEKSIPVLAAILVVLLAVVAFYGFSKRNVKLDYNFVTMDALEIYADQTSQRTFVYNSKGDMLYKLDEFMHLSFTPDHTAALLFGNNSGRCMYVNAEKKIEFTSSLSGVAALSDDGNYIVYSVSGGLDKYYLRLYNVAKGTDTLIDNQNRRFYQLNVLPGGQMITYATYGLTEEGEVQELRSYRIRNQGEPELIGENILVFAESFDQKLTYYLEFSNRALGRIYVKTGDKTVMLSSGIKGPIFFNGDYTQILIEDEGQYYLSINGEERQMLYQGMLEKVLQPVRGTEVLKESGIFRYSFQSFGQKLLRVDKYKIIFIDKNYQPKELGLAAEGNTVTVARDGKSLFCINTKHQLVEFKDLPNRSIEIVWAEGVEEYRVAPDQSQVYYLKGKELYYKKRGRDEIRVDDNVRSICSNASGDILFYLKDYTGGKGKVYYSKNGAAAAALEDGEGVSEIAEWNYGVVLQKLVNDRNAAFYNTNGLKFAFIMDGVDFIDEDKRLFPTQE